MALTSHYSCIGKSFAVQTIDLINQPEICRLDVWVYRSETLLSCILAVCEPPTRLKVKQMAQVKASKKKHVYNPAIEGTTLPMHAALTPHFGYCFTKSALKLRKHLSDEMEKVGVQLPQMGLMIILAKSGPMNQISLGEEMAIDKATMVKILDVMEEANVVRRKPDPADRRVKLVELTTKGRGLIPKMRKMRETVENQFLSVLTKTEAAELRRLISKLVQAKF